ncbi:hypothetical protein GCM10007874_42030 [Labrys miyagiensis]|uniref:Uncharacterized protein n=1 Tax=Labrys miyagiensis TaxID=346912 RepID=A0ABQ6CSL7_9HYPH|nr:hypothetical protein [Labrys miyagiensis]GLS21186.1 hypothetical protein GCM10007874_42030 [Labrys miyagiensis]
MTLSAKDVIAILGPVDETRIADILATEATVDDLAEAWAWINSDEALINAGRSLPSGKVADLVDLLSTDMDEFENEES